MWGTFMQRRRFLQMAAGAVALPAVSQRTWALDYPARPVRIIVGFGAGGAPDIVARVISQWLSERLGQQFIIENRPGAAGNIATEAAVRAPADGYTLSVVAISNAVNATLYDNLNFDFLRDLAPVAGISRETLALEVHPSFSVETVGEYITYAKVNPDKINYASAGTGTSQHMAGELFKMMAGIRLVHVPYRSSGAAIADLIGGQVQSMFAPLPPSIQYVRSGAVRALAVTTATRSEALPELPVVGDFVPGYEVTAWYGLCAPKGTPTEILDKLNKEINASLMDSRIKARLTEIGSTGFAVSRSDFRKHLEAETEKWSKVVRAANMKSA
jgi:tripartite-type tricarboxylate transporter receptor subunit TctC